MPAEWTAISLQSEVLLTEILHTADPHGAGTVSVLLGPSPAENAVWLTVKPANLLAGLQAWKDGDPNDPGLVDRVEEIFRGQSPAGALGNN